MIIDASGRIVLRRSWDAHLAKLIPIHDADPGTYCAIAVFTDGAISNARFVIP
jgi:hypothetical protein